ncbi:MAG: hypothetical protein LAO20_07735 [Acidobacteriia bacterium]|nr:hypothetical protein [Terriglobia bacterium]
MKRVLLWGALLILLVLLVARGPQELDDAGWIPHKLQTDVMLNGDWMLGESRVCDALAFNVVAPRINELECVVGDPDVTQVSRHSFPVKYWGKVKRPKIFSGPYPSGYHQLKWEWRCQRQAARLVCWALN